MKKKILFSLSALFFLCILILFLVLFFSPSCTPGDPYANPPIPSLTEPSCSFNTPFRSLPHLDGSFSLSSPRIYLSFWWFYKPFSLDSYLGFRSCSDFLTNSSVYSCSKLSFSVNSNDSHTGFYYDTIQGFDIISN